MRRTALEKLVLDHVRGLDADDYGDVRDILLREQAEEPEGAFGAFCHYLDPERDASREDVATTVHQVFAGLNDRVADQIARDEKGFHILAAISRDGEY